MLHTPDQNGAPVPQTIKPVRFDAQHDPQHSSHFGEIFTASKLVLLGYATSAIFFVLLCAIPSILKFTGIEVPALNTIDVQGRSLLPDIDLTTFSTGFVWFVIGCVVYLLFWGLLVFVIDGYNNVVVSATFVHPKSFHNSTYWSAIIGRIIVRMTSVILLIATILTAYEQLLPYWANDIRAFSIPDDWLMSIVRMLVVIASWMALMHIIAILVRLSLMRRRIFG